MAELLAKAEQQQASDSLRRVVQSSRRSASTRNDGAGDEGGRRDVTVQQNPHVQGEKTALLVHSRVGAG